MALLFFCIRYSADVIQLDWSVSSLATVLAAAATTAAAVFAARSAGETKKATQAQLVAQLLHFYSSNDMFEAMRTMGEIEAVAEKRDLDIATTDTSELFVSSDQTFEIDKKRRLASHYFGRAYRLHKGGYLSLSSLEIVCDVAGYRLLYDVIEPLTQNLKKSIRVESSDDWIQDLRKLVPPPYDD